MLTFAQFILPALMVLAAPAAATPCGCRGGAAKAAYFMTNDAKNNVVAVKIGADGKLSGGTRTFTGGYGSISIDGDSNALAKTDGLVSQGSLSVAGDNLFVVNSGSNTVSMFSIDKNDPTKLTLVGKPAPVPAEFPSTVAASAKNNLVCMGASGAKAGVACANFDDKDGIGAFDDLRAFDLKQTTPPVGPLNTVSQVFFSNDEETLFTTVKGDPTKNNTGFLSAFPVEVKGTGDSCVVNVATKGEQKSPNGTAVLFGAQPVPYSSKIFSTDASFGAVVLDVKDQANPQVLGKKEISGQKATCWVAINHFTQSAFVTDVGTPRIIEMSLDDASVLGELDMSNTGVGGLIDLKSSGKFVYALAPGDRNTKVMVLDVHEGMQKAKVIQQFDASKFVGSSAQGMAILERQ